MKASISMIFGGLLLWFTSCTILQPMTASNYHRTNPPNCLEIEHNFYCDKTEMSNLDYREYLYWLSEVFSDLYPEVYLNALPDTSVWLQLELECAESFIEIYLRHPAFDEYPVVGISQEQARQYSKWRSDRVFEMLLIKLKRITPLARSELTEDNYFTIERYYNGELSNILPSKEPPVAYYPEFRLPSIEERQRILRYADASDEAYFKKCRSRKCRDCKGDFPVFNSDVTICPRPIGGGVSPLNHSREGCASALFHLRGNANEWLAEPNTAAGGGWNDKRSEILEKDTFFVQTPNAWTGFCNVCQWKRWEGK